VIHRRIAVAGLDRHPAQQDRAQPARRLDRHDLAAAVDEVPGQSAAACADVERHLDIKRQRLDHRGMDRLVARELVPTFGLEVIHQGPEQRPHDAVIRLAGGNA